MSREHSPEKRGLHFSSRKRGELKSRLPHLDGGKEIPEMVLFTPDNVKVIANHIASNPDYDAVPPDFYHSLAIERKGKILAAKIGHIIERELPSLSPSGIPSKVLDIAAGTGIVSSHLHGLGYDVVATDLSKRALDFLQAHNEHILVKRGNMNERLPFDDASFDGAVTLWANRFVKGDTMAREVYRILRLGGKFIWPIDTLEYSAWKCQNGIEQVTQPRNWEPILNKIGFSVQSIKIPLNEKLKNLNVVYPNTYFIATK